MALAKSKTGAGKLAAPTKSARRDNPLCGDRVTIDVKLDDGARSPRSPTRCAAACSARPRPRRSPSVAVGRDAAGIAELRHDAERAIGREEGKAHRAVRRLRAGRQPQVAPRMRAAAVRGAERGALLVSSSPAPRLCHSPTLSVRRASHGRAHAPPSLIVALLGLLAFPVAFAQDLALKRVMLSSGGLGYFEYEATVEGDATLKLTVSLRAGRRRAEEPGGL